MSKFKSTCWIFIFTSHSLYSLTTLHVSLSSDNNPGGMGDPGDLRYRLNTMNADLATTPDDYAIVFDFPMTIQLNGILPIINNSANPVNITIGNPGSTPTVTLDGNSGAYSGFFIPTGNVTIQNMIFQNFTAKGGNGGDGISGGGGGMGAGGAIYAPQTFLNGSNPAVILQNVLINNCSAVGGNGGNYFSSSTGDEGGGGGGGLSGNGGSITVAGSTGGAGGGGFGGDGGNVISSDGGGGGGGGIGSRATLGTITNLGNGGSDQDPGQSGNGYGLTATGGTGGGGNAGGSAAGGGGGGGGITPGGGGGGSAGFDGSQAQGSIPPGGAASPSGGNGGDGGGGGGGGVVTTSFTNGIDGQAGTGGYGGGGGGGAGTGASDAAYTVQGGSGGIGGGGGGGGVNQSGTTPADGGNSLGGGGGGGGPSQGLNAPGGNDTGSLGGGAGGFGADSSGFGFGGGGGGGGSGLGGAIFVDSGLNFTIEALSGIPTTFNTTNNTVQAGTRGTGGPGGSDGFDGSALGNSIFLRNNSSLILLANDANDLLTLGDQVSFIDDTSFGAGSTSVFVRGNGTVIYNGTTDYQGNITVNNANFKVNGLINNAPVSVCRNVGFSPQRGTLSGTGTVAGNVLVNSGTISPDANGTLTLGSLSLNSASPGALGSLVHIEIDSHNTSLVSVNNSASLAGILEIQLEADALPGSYTILTSAAITGTFDAVTFTSTRIPDYSLSYLPAGTPTFVRFDFLGYPVPPTPPVSTIEPASNLQGAQRRNNFGFEYELYNQLTWTPSPSPEVVGYLLYRDGQEIAIMNAATRSYQDHNRPRGVSFVYSLVAFDGNDNISSPVTVTVP